MKKNFIDQLKRRTEDPRYFSTVIAGDFELSIQASSSHYCEPRENYLDPEDYTEFEMAIFKGSREWVQVREELILKDFPRINKLIDRTEEGECPVSSYVPANLIQDLYAFLCINTKVNLNEMKKTNVRLEKAIDMVRLKYIDAVNDFIARETELNVERVELLEEILNKLEAIRDAE